MRFFNQQSTRSGLFTRSGLSNKRSRLFLLVATLCALCLSSAQAGIFSNSTRQLLPEDEAFQVIATTDGASLIVNWAVADDYYMYRDQFHITSKTAGVEVGPITFPQGVVEDDPEFGEVEVYFYNAELKAELSGTAANGEVILELRGQGCNKPVGVCYPPQTRSLSVQYSGGGSPQISDTASTDAQAPATKTFWSYVLAAFGAGILLSFTPCVLPMIPILAGVIAGQQQPSKLRSGWLACCYVGGTIVTYIIAGWVAGATGTQLQAHFQNPWVIGFICALLILLAASLFGWFKIQLSSTWQSKLNSTGTDSKSASVTSFSLGLISALVVGACVSPILILALGAAITQGDPVLGAAIMGSMALGMGLLLILFGFGAGWILPRAGAWMTQIQILFGFMVLGVAIYIASGLAFVPSLYLWAGLLLTSGCYLWQISENDAASILKSTLRALGLATALWGAMALVGAATGGRDILTPLSTLSFSQAEQPSNLPFNSVTDLASAQQIIASAKREQRAVLIDFYADWCLDCKRMHRTTFKQASVADALQDWTLLEIDVTDTSVNSEEVKKHFGVFGPPATLFIGADGAERTQLRQYGYINEQDFLTLLARTANKQ